VRDGAPLLSALGGRPRGQPKHLREHGGRRARVAASVWLMMGTGRHWSVCSRTVQASKPCLP